jgi:type VI secretion system protein VasG
MSVSLKSLIGKLNHETRSAVEAAAGICLSRTHYDVEIEHFLMKLLDSSNSDAASILKHFGVDRARFSKELTDALDRLKTGNARFSVPSTYTLHKLKLVILYYLSH